MNDNKDNQQLFFRQVASPVDKEDSIESLIFTVGYTLGIIETIGNTKVLSNEEIKQDSGEHTMYRHLIELHNEASEELDERCNLYKEGYSIPSFYLNLHLWIQSLAKKEEEKEEPKTIKFFGYEITIRKAKNDT